MPDLRDSKPLSSGDALFLYLEREGAPLSIAAVMEFEGHLSLEDCTASIESKLPLIPRYRQRVVNPPFNLGLPTWGFDPEFDIHNHVREIALRHGTEAEFKSAVGRLFSATMRRDRPLWDFTLFQGLKGDRTGAVIRIHHCLADGISGIGLMNILLDASPFAPPLPKVEQIEPPSPRTPSLTEALVNSCLTSLERALAVQADLLEMARQFLVSAAQPRSISEHQPSADPTHAAVAAFDEMNRLVPEFGSPTERMPFNVVCQGPQKFNWTSISLDDMKAVKNACEGTINDVVLSVVSSAIARYNKLHGARLSKQVLRIIVPINLRGNGDMNELGNRITFLPVNIPLNITDPRKHVEAVRRAVARARAAKMAEVIGIVGTIVETIPTPLQAMFLPMLSYMPLSVCNMIVTNVPGPQIPLYLLGHKMLACYPRVPIGGEMGMNCAVLSYDGNVYFGFTGDAHAIPDQKNLEKFVNASFAELKKSLGLQPKQQRKHVAKPKPEPKLELARSRSASVLQQKPVVQEEMPDARIRTERVAVAVAPAA